MQRAKYNLSIDQSAKTISLADVGGPVSLVADIDNIIVDLVRIDIAVDAYRIIFRKPDGRIDGVVTRSGRFFDFYTMGAMTEAEAIRTMPKPQAPLRGWQGLHRSDGARIVAFRQHDTNLDDSYTIARRDGQIMTACPCCGDYLTSIEAAKRVADYCWPLAPSE